MQWKLLSWATLPCLLCALPVCAQTAPATSARQGEPHLSLPSETFSLHRDTWPATLNWQAVPTGVGEVAVFPNPPGADEFRWGKHRLVGTELGLLSGDANGWKIVPGLYGHSVRIVSEGGELLWIEQVGEGLVALNPDLEVVRRLPSVHGRCVAVESEGFWCLEKFGNGWSGATAHDLVEYRADGTEKRRFVVQELGLVPAPEPAPAKKQGGFGVGFSSGGIAWAGVDSKAVWVSLNDYHFGGFGGGDAPISAGEEKLGRLDRASGKFTAFSWPAKHRATQFLLLPGQVQWLSQSGRDDYDVYQLDKETSQISRVMKFVTPGLDLSTKGKNLWLQSRKSDPYDVETRIYSRETFDAVSNEEAGTAPSRIPARPDFSSLDSVWSGILAVDENGIWLSGPSLLLHVRDDGILVAQDIHSILKRDAPPKRFASGTSAGELLWFLNDSLMRVQLDGSVTRLLLNQREGKPDEQLYLDFLAATKERVWYDTNKKQLVTLLPDLSNPREIAPSPLFGGADSSFRRIDDEKGRIALGNQLYAWAESGDLLRVDGTTGQVNVVESWKRDIPANESPELAAPLTGKQKPKCLRVARWPHRFHVLAKRQI